MTRKHMILAVSAALLGLLLIGLITLSIRPELGAQAASPMRRLLGNEAVARIETLVFMTQDGVRRVEYGLGLAEPASPWIAPGAPVELATAPVAGTSLPVAEPTPPLSMVTPAPKDRDGLAALPTGHPVAATPAVSVTAAATVEAVATPAALARWSLPALTPLSGAEGEGTWQAYLFDAAGEPVALRTFLLPDPERPYAVAGVVSFDLTRTSLGYVLGLEEPRLPGGPRGSGRLPVAVLDGGALLATFNGGFMAAHGEYGAMANGTFALPAKPNFATVAVSPDGTVAIGKWGTDIDPGAEYTSWRQNAQMVLDNGQVNERVHSGSVVTWGGNIDGYIVTWRSGLGLNEAGDVLYYFAGPSLSMESLALAMSAAGVHDGLLLDINPTWVHFAAVKRAGDGELAALPLFDEGMESAPDRYLRVSARDFFYVTLRE